MEHLTQKERRTLNDAMDIILAHTAYDASWQITASHYAGCEKSYGATYFDSAHEQHSFLPGETFADMVEAALRFEAQAILQAEAVKARRIQSLRDELAKLTGDAA